MRFRDDGTGATGAHELGEGSQDGAGKEKHVPHESGSVTTPVLHKVARRTHLAE